MTDKRYVFIDADSILYTSAYGDRVRDAEVLKRYDRKIDYIKVQSFADEVFVAVKGYNNFREKLDPEYKAQRKPIEENMRRKLKMVHEYAINQGAVRCDGWEADDQVRAWAWEATQDGIPWVLAGIDKDLLQIPGTHFNYGGNEKKPLSEEKKWTFIEQEEGDFKFACQLLTGDVVDNIKCITNVGAVKAAKAVGNKDRKGMMSTIVEMYKGEFGDSWENKLRVNTNLMYMRRWPDDEFKYEDWLNG